MLVVKLIVGKLCVVGEVWNAGKAQCEEDKEA